jgi:hypothetical protein
MWIIIGASVAAILIALGVPDWIIIFLSIALIWIGISPGEKES